MTVTSLPQAAQDALRIETLSTAHALELCLQRRAPSSAASMLALAIMFARRADANVGGDVGATFITALRTFTSPAFAARPGDVEKCLAYGSDDTTLPPSTEDVVAMLRAAAVNEASSL